MWFILIVCCGILFIYIFISYNEPKKFLLCAACIINKIMNQIFENSLKNYIKMEKLGQGTFAIVERVVCITDSQEYALKTVKYMEMKQKNKKSALNEVKILSEIEHPNIIRFKQAFFDNQTKSLCTIMELANNGDLASRIKSKKIMYSHFSEQQIWVIGRDIINGISALHQRNIIHRDIKPANILFGEGDVAKIGDLNVSVKLDINQNYLSTQTGTPYYASPQVWSNQTYSFDCDVWSFGCVLYELCTLNKPFEAKSLERLYRRIIHLKYDPIPYRYSYNLANVIEKCLQNKNKRISVSELKRIFNLHNKPLSNSHRQNDIKSPLSLVELRVNSQSELFEDIFMPKSPLSKCLNPEQKYGFKPEASIQKKFSALDKYLKPERKLPSSFLTGACSQKYISTRRQIEQVQNTLSRRFEYLKSPTRKSFLPTEHELQNRKPNLQHF